MLFRSSRAATLAGYAYADKTTHIELCSIATSSNYDCLTPPLFHPYLGPTYSERLTKWRIEHADLAVGPLGGLAGDERCDVCNAPLFRDERNTKCCLGRFKNTQDQAEWYGPFCSFPNVTLSCRVDLEGLSNIQPPLLLTLLAETPRRSPIVS